MGTDNELLSTGASLGWITVGIVLSLVLPLAVKTLAGARPKLEGLERQSALSRFWTWIDGTKYVKILLSALVVAVVLKFLIGGDLRTPKEAIIFGFAWEGLVSKFAKGNA
jgi:hypothetical protein